MSDAPTATAAATPRKADAFVVSCIDPRLTDDTTFLLATLGRAERYSEMRIAGAALAAVDPARPAWNAALWENLAASRQLHGVREVLFVNHRDCGAMNLFAGRRLSDDPAAELRVHQEVMQRAAAEVRRRHPDMTVELRLMELDGSAQRLHCPACAPAGLRAEAVQPDTTPGATQAFADLVALRLRDGAPAAEAERALLAEGVARFGLTAAAAKARDAAALLRAQADRRGRVGADDVARAAALRRAVALAEEEGLAPRPQGLTRSTRWYRRIAAA